MTEGQTLGLCLGGLILAIVVLAYLADRWIP